MTPTPDSPPIRLLDALTACPRCRGPLTVEHRDDGDDDFLRCGNCARMIDPVPLTVAFLRRRGVDSAVLAAAVEAAAAAHARQVNKGELDAQVPYLLSARGLQGLHYLLGFLTSDTAPVGGAAAAGSADEPGGATAYVVWHCGVCDMALQSYDPERPRCDNCGRMFAVDPGVQELVAPEVIA